MIFASTMVYALGKELGFEGAEAEFHRQLGEPTNESLPCVRTIHRLRSLDSVGLRLDCNAVSIGQARSRAFHEAVESMADVWIAIDDDVEADTATLKHLLEAVRGEPAICIAPYTLREREAVVSVALEPGGKPRLLDTGGVVWPARGGGLGLCAVSRSALLRMSLAYASSLGFVDQDGVHRLAMFHELIRSNVWHGEDISFCERAREAGVRVEALGTGHVKHAGQTLQLDVVRPAPPTNGPAVSWP